MELGQPARVTLEALTALTAEAQRLGFDRERAALTMMISQTHSRLGHQRTAEGIAHECVRIAEDLLPPHCWSLDVGCPRSGVFLPPP